MSWPKAAIAYKGQTRTATVWGLYSRGSGAVVEGKPVDMPELAVSIYCPDGPVDYPNPRYKSLIIPSQTSSRSTGSASTASTARAEPLSSGGPPGVFTVTSTVTVRRPSRRTSMRLLLQRLVRSGS